MIETALVGSIGLLLGTWIVLPFFYAAGRDSAADALIDALIESKHAVYRCILDLEFDHRVGKVSGEDYQVMRSQHEAEALAILRQIDQTASTVEIADSLEAEISAARQRLRAE